MFIGLIQTTLILTVGARIFDVPINGSMVDLYLAAALFIAATLTLGLVISTFARTQFQAFQMSFLTLLPSILLSGFVFPFDGMPRLAQLIAQVLPLTHFVEIIRGILLRGAPLVEMQVPVLKLARVPGRHAGDRDAAIPQAARLTFVWPVAVAGTAAGAGSGVPEAVVREWVRRPDAGAPRKELELVPNRHEWARLSCQYSPYRRRRYCELAPLGFCVGPLRQEECLSRRAGALVRAVTQSNERLWPRRNILMCQA